MSDARIPPCDPAWIRSFDSSGTSYRYVSLAAIGEAFSVKTSRLPISLRVILESVARHCDEDKIMRRDVEALVRWNAAKPASEEIPFTVARILLQDFTGVPLIVDLAAMRSAVARLGRDPRLIEPRVPVDLVIDHSVQVDVAGVPTAFQLNMEHEFRRNRERYEFLKWGQQAFSTVKVVPPGIGIVHQVNLEYLAKGVIVQDGEGSHLAYPDTLVGTDSHTTMINGLGIVGWGVGGIEAEASMLGQPLYFLTPEVVGVYLTGKLADGVTATDLTLAVTQMLRKANVVGKFVEFYGPGAASLTLPDRATIANMAPEYGATIGFFGVDEQSLAYFAGTGRTAEHVALVRDYFKAQQLFGIPEAKDAIDYSSVLALDLGSIQPSVAGPKRPQDRIELSHLKEEWMALFEKPLADGGYGKSCSELGTRYPVTGDPSRTIGHGSILIAAITSCTNTSNPSVMLAAGLLAKKAVERGLHLEPTIKASLAPGSRVVSDYLQKTGLQHNLDALGFHLVGYGCTTCIGNSGPLDPKIEETLLAHDLIAASVLSGNRNFEARVHPSLRANFLMSPPLVVAFALAGRVDIDFSSEPLGVGSDGRAVYLKDIWPSHQEVADLMQTALKPEVFRRLYSDFAEQNPSWNAIETRAGRLYNWRPESTYIQEPPFFEHFSIDLKNTAQAHSIEKMRALAIFGDSITTDHISPAGSIKKTSPAGRYLIDHGVAETDFNSYGARRGNDRVMMRGTFANVRIRNNMTPGVEGGVTRNLLTGEIEAIYDAAMAYQKTGVPLVVFGGKEYGTGSSRDWAAKGTALLGVRAVIASSFERIHRSNLVGMGVLPCCFEEGVNAATLALDGTEYFTLRGLSEPLSPRQRAELLIERADGTHDSVSIIVRLDTPIEIEYYRHGGILPYVLRELLEQT